MTDQQGRTANITGLAGLFEGGLALVAVLVGYWVGHSPLATVPCTFSAWQENGLAIAWGGLATLPLLAGLWCIERLPLRMFAKLRRFVHRLVVPLFRNASLAELALISLIAGIGEELLFRGLIQDGLATAIGGHAGVSVGLIVSSLLFGIAHAVTRTYAALATLVGFYLGGLFLLTGNLLSPIVAHAAYDFVALVFLLRAVPARH
jgi:membrane protease YdiL (CAAX protease family)